MLHKQDITLQRLKKQLFVFDNMRRVAASSVSVFTRLLATLIKAGIPVVQALDLVAESINDAAMTLMIHEIRDDVSAGLSLADSLRRHPNSFDELFCSLVAAGEQSGALDIMLARLADYQERVQTLRSRIKKAMHYPAAVLAVAFLVTAVLLIKVVPQFAASFDSFGAELPAYTLLLIRLSELAADHWWQAAIACLLLAVLLRKIHARHKGFADLLARSQLRLPLIGSIIAKSCCVRFARTLATSLTAGVPLIEALETVAGATGHIIYYNACQKVKVQVSGGISLALAIRSTELFPALVSQMTQIGEESGTLELMLEKCALHYEAEVDNTVDGLTSLLEPIIMSVLGLLIGGLMIAMYLPVFQLGAVV